LNRRVTPKYNRSVPAALKNAIDAGSRPYGASVWSREPAGIISQSPGLSAGSAPTTIFAKGMVFLNMPAMQRPEAYIGPSEALFDADGKLLEGGRKAVLDGFLPAFAPWVVLHAE
jgi:chromate reductase